MIDWSKFTPVTFRQNKRRKRMKILQVEHLEFVPGSIVGDKKYPEYIFVFTHKRNGKTRKKKVDCIGHIFKHPKNKHWVFVPETDWCYNYEVCGMVGTVLWKLTNKKIKYNRKKGEFITNE